ncbi:hypothetical protein [Emticicia fontis]
MKRILFSIAVVTISLFQFSCGTTVPLLSNRKSYEVDTASVYHLPSMITSIAKANRQEFNEIYSDSSLNIRSRDFNQHLPKYMTPVSFEFKNPEEEQEMIKSFFDIINMVEREKKIKGIKLSSYLVNYLESKNTKYLILTFQAGFTRTASNYGTQVAKGLGIGLLTLGLVRPIPIKSNSTIVCCVLDTRNKNIAFYRKRTAEVEPVDEKVINRQIRIIIDSWLTASR